jgi:hypothetical protein
MVIKSKKNLKKGKIEIDLTGPAGNAYAVMGNCREWAKQLGYTSEEIKALMDDMMSSDYEHLIQVADGHFGKFVIFYK